MKYVENRKLWRALLFSMLVPLAVVAFWLSPIDQPIQGQLAGLLKFLHARGVPGWFNYQFVEASANVALFIPLGTAASLAFVEKRWWQIAASCLTVSGVMELGQFLFLHNRFASPLDLVTNTVGAVIGALVAAAALKRVQASRMPAEGL